MHVAGGPNCVERERKGDYLGKTVQVVPHVTNEIQEWIEKVARVPTDGRPGAPDVELGGRLSDRPQEADGLPRP